MKFIVSTMVSNKVVLIVAVIVGVTRFSSADRSTCGIEESACKELKDLPYVTEYNGECSDSSQCEWLGENSECRYVCRCKEGFRWYLGKCRKYVGLGEQCSDSIDCYDGYNLQSLTCLSETCQCTNGYYQRGETDCRKVASNINDTCALDMDCQVTGIDTVCHIGKCRTVEDASIKEYGEEIEETNFSFNVLVDETSCTQDADCDDIHNSYCYDKTGTCICKPQYFFNSNGTSCIPELGVEAECTSDSDCTIKPGKCEDGVCYCRDYYFTGDGNRNCIKTISQNNWNCLSKEWCYALGSYSYCASSSGTCTCSKIADYEEENNLCIWNGTDDPNICTSDVDCKYIQNGYCVDELCGCRAGYVLEDSRCVPDLFSECDDNKVICEMMHSECRDGICQCVDNYVAIGNKACYEQSNHRGDSCKEDVQCSATVVYSKCINTICDCDENHIGLNDTCYPKTEYGSYCNNRQECILSSPETMREAIVCRNHLCQCPTGETRNGNVCSSGTLITGNFLVLVAVWLVNCVFSVS